MACFHNAKIQLKRNHLETLTLQQIYDSDPCLEMNAQLDNHNHMGNHLTLVPLVTSATGIITIAITCIVYLIFIVPERVHVFLYPYVSIMGTLAPARYFFQVGMCATAFLSNITNFFTFIYYSEILKQKSSVEKFSSFFPISLQEANHFSLKISWVSMIGLIGLSIIPVSEHFVLHNIFAIAFFVSGIVVLAINYKLFEQVEKQRPSKWYRLCKSYSYYCVMICGSICLYLFNHYLNIRYFYEPCIESE